MPDAIELKHYCEEIFSDYNITDFKIINNEVVLKVKRKKDYKKLAEILHEITKAFETIPSLNYQTSIN